MSGKTLCVKGSLGFGWSECEFCLYDLFTIFWEFQKYIHGFCFYRSLI